jgi:hypothetical protein
LSACAARSRSTLLLGHVARDGEDARRAAVDDERRGVRHHVAQSAVGAEQAQLDGLRLAGERAAEALARAGSRSAFSTSPAKCRPMSDSFA